MQHACRTTIYAVLVSLTLQVINANLVNTAISGAASTLVGASSVDALASHTSSQFSINVPLAKFLGRTNGLTQPCVMSLPGWAGEAAAGIRGDNKPI